jgi:hypothetical protein
MAKYKEGDKVHIHSKKWFDDYNYGGKMFIFMVINKPMYDNYAGKNAIITKVGINYYKLDIDEEKWFWQDWMFESKYTAFLSAKEAAKAMLEGEVLLDRDGRRHLWDNDKGLFIVSPYEENSIFKVIIDFNNLYRNKQKNNKEMTRFEKLAWASSSDSFGYVVRKKSIIDDANWGDWQLPQYYNYDNKDFIGVIQNYQRAVLLPDGSGIDKKTIENF